MVRSEAITDSFISGRSRWRLVVSGLSGATLVRSGGGANVSRAGGTGVPVGPGVVSFQSAIGHLRSRLEKSWGRYLQTVGLTSVGKGRHHEIAHWIVK